MAGNNGNGDFAVLMLKPDAFWKQGLAEKIIAELNIAGFDWDKNPKEPNKDRSLQMSLDQAMLFYPPNEEWAVALGEKLKATYAKTNLSIKDVFGMDDDLSLGLMMISWLWDYVTNGLVTPLKVYNADKDDKIYEQLKKQVGHTCPQIAKVIDPGSIRGKYGFDSIEVANFSKRAVYNLVHCSASPTDAEREANALGL